MSMEASLKPGRNCQQASKVAERVGNKSRPKLRVIMAAHDKSAEQLAKLEAENAKLRRRAAELAMEIRTLRGG
jgi:hypothetical protein